MPRFLQNDIARYWRTVAVDFAYKRRDRGGEEWALRTVKLRMSRKLTYAAGLVACFRCSLLPIAHPEFEALSADERARITIDDLVKFLDRTPLEMLAWAVLHLRVPEQHARNLFASYAEFLSILDSDKRARLKELSYEDATNDPVFKSARELGHRFQSALDALFFAGEGQAFTDLTKIYGVF